MRYDRLAWDFQCACTGMTPVQREGVRRSIIAPNLALPENVELWKQVLPAMGGSMTDADSTPLAEVRASLEDLPLTAWRAINNTIFVLHRGNVFDETFELVEGGGIDFHFGARYELFFGYLADEKRRVEAMRPEGHIPSALDVGCWQGTLMCEMLQRGWITAGTDVCDETMGTLFDRLGAMRRPDAARCRGYYPGWAHEALYNVANGSYDVVVAQETLEHIPREALQATCDEMLRVARHSVIVEVPGWDDGWPLHLRVYTLEELADLFGGDGRSIEVLQVPGGGVYTTIKVVKQ